jgi:K+-transporting ATPase ATPase B chain
VPSIAVYVALLVCLIPTTIGGLLSAIGIAGMDRVMQHNVLAMSGKAVEAAGDVNTLLLDKTGTITLGNRQAVAFLPVNGATEMELADAAQLSSLADETPEGRSIVVLAKEKYNIRGREVAEHEAHFIPFSAYTRMSGVDIDGRHLRKGATDAILKFVEQEGGAVPLGFTDAADRISRNEGAHRAVAGHGDSLGNGYRRQPVDRGGDRRGSGRGRLSRPGDTYRQTGVHPQGTGGRPHGGHDRRRHQ